jgi:hemolysin III
MMATKTQPAGLYWDYDRFELIADAVVHAIGWCLGLAGALALLIVATNSVYPTEIASAIIYVVGLLSMLSLSAAYNVLPVSHAKSVLRRLDHSAIYVMIAGTYTAVIAQMKSDVASLGLLAGVWLTAAVGVALKLLFPGRFDRLAVVLYLLLGWSGVVVYQPVAAALPNLSVSLLAIGGALYSIGVIFHRWQSLRFQNAIWHTFVLVAACCHYWAILYCVAHG